MKHILARSHGDLPLWCRRPQGIRSRNASINTRTHTLPCALIACSTYLPPVAFLLHSWPRCSPRTCGSHAKPNFLLPGALLYLPAAATPNLLTAFPRLACFLLCCTASLLHSIIEPTQWLQHPPQSLNRQDSFGRGGRRNTPPAVKYSTPRLSSFLVLSIFNMNCGWDTLW